jgi:hypothetical protein
LVFFKQNSLKNKPTGFVQACWISQKACQNFTGIISENKMSGTVSWESAFSIKGKQTTRTGTGIEYEHIQSILQRQACLTLQRPLLIRQGFRDQSKSVDEPKRKQGVMTNQPDLILIQVSLNKKIFSPAENRPDGRWRS